jgi:hypothetical protein
LGSLSKPQRFSSPQRAAKRAVGARTAVARKLHLHRAISRLKFRERSMKYLLAVTILGIPVLGYAGPITQPVQVVDVEWWGTLAGVTTHGPLPSGVPRVKEYLHGTLRIIPALAPPDIVPDDPYTSGYLWFNYCQDDCTGAPSNFVTSTLQRYDGASSGDDVFMIDSAGGTNAWDYFGVTNSESAISGSGGRFLNVTVTTPDFDFIHGDGILQEFDISSTAADGVGFGSASETFDNAGRFVSRAIGFVVDRLKVTPKVCRI